MAQSLGSLYVELKAETGAFVSGLGKASYEAKKAAKDIQAGFDKMGSAMQQALAQMGPFGSALASLGSSASTVFDGLGGAGGGLSIAIAGIGALGVAAIASAGSLAALAISGADLVENLSNISQKTGISTHDLQVFQAAGSTVGVSLDDMVVATRKFDGALAGVGKNAGFASIVLRELGVTSRDPKEALLEVADSFKKMPDGVDKANDAIALFGKSGLNLIPLLNKGRDGIAEWSKNLAEYGSEVTPQAKAATESYRDATAKLGLVFDGLKISMTAGVLPALTSLVKEFAEGQKTVENFFTAILEHPGDVAKQLAMGETFANIAKQTDQIGGSGGAGNKADAAAQTAKETAAEKQKYQMIKAGGEIAYELEQKRKDLIEAETTSHFKDAETYLSQIKSLEKALEIEKAETTEAERLLDARKKLRDLINEGNGGQGAGLFTRGKSFRSHQSFAPTDPTAGAPEIAAPATGDLIGAVIGTGSAKAAAAFGSGKAQLDDFYSHWTAAQKGNEASVNADYDKQLDDWKELLDKQAISQAQFNDVSKKLEQQRQDGLKDIRKELGTSTLSDAFGDMFADVAKSGKDFARSLTTDIGDAIDGLNQQLSKFIATGKGLNIKKLGQGLEETLTSSVLKKGESSLFGALGFGGGKLGTNTNPMIVKNVDALSGAPGAGGGPGGLLGGLMGQGGPLSFLSKIPGLAGFFADGGDVTPGQLHVVGENGPEFFVPHSAGRIAPSLKMSNGPAPVSLSFHVHGVQDADSFKRSQSQTFASLQQQLAIASSRSR